MPLFQRAPGEDKAGGRWQEALEAALRVSEIASSAMSLPDAMREVLQTAVRLLDAAEGSIMLIEEGEQDLVLVAAHGLPPNVSMGLRVRLGESVAGRVLATGRPLLLGDVDRDAFVNFVPKARSISSSLVVPLRAQGRAIGVLSLANTTAAHRFTEEDLRVAQMFGDQAAGVIYRARLHERAEQRSSDLMALVDSSRGLLGTLDLESLLQRVLDGGARLAGAKDGFACLFEAESLSVSRGVFRGIDKELIPGLIRDPSVMKAVESVEVVAVDHEQLGTLVAVGLKTSRGTRGVLLVTADRELIEARIDLLRAFGQQCGSAIGSAELHSDIGRKESELSSIIQAVPHPIVLVDSHQRIVALNAAAEQLFGISTVFSSGAPVESVFNHPALEQLLGGRGEVTSELLFGTPPRTYKVRVNDVNVPGAPIGRVLIMDDISSEREIVQRQRDFVSMIGHELRTPLTIIKGFARTLLRRIDAASVTETREGLNTIDQRALQLERLIEDLLYVSQIEAREASLRIETIDLSAIIRTVADDVIQNHLDREIQLDVKDQLRWPCDETKVALVLRHLLENALKYSTAPSPITVRAVSDSDELRFDVIDRGAGILSSDIPHIFERFRQLDSSLTREHGGTGVGLYLCAQLIRMHGGRIWVDSTWGKGSTFSFSLPRRASTTDVVTIRARDSRTA
jgi:signal transduction histidine kinase/putative methionine-R-sulfoxide reductase with GAF domain